MKSLKIIIAEINSQTPFDEVLTDQMASLCSEMGVAPPDFIVNWKSLLEKMEENKNRRVVLFTNFPLDSSWSDGGSSLREKLASIIIISGMDAETYKLSSLLFHAIGRQDAPGTIHFITGAPPETVSDDYLQNLLPSSKVTVIRKPLWRVSTTPYMTHYSNYLREKIKDALSELAQ